MTPLGTSELRAALVAVGLFYVAGLPLARRLSVRAGGSVLLWALPSSLGLLMGGLFLGQVLGLSLRASVWPMAAVIAAAALVCHVDQRRERGLNARMTEDAATIPWFEGFVITVVTLGLLAVGAPLAVRFDSLDHLAAIRRSLLSGEILPTDVFYQGGDGGGWDPRKGLLHPLYAWVCLATRTDPLNLWRVLPAVLAPGLVLAISRFIRVWTGPGRVSRAALMLWILAGSGSGFIWLTKAGYPNRVAYALALFATSLFVEEMTGNPRPGRRWGMALLAFTATLMHVVAGALVLLALACCGLSAVLRRTGKVGKLRRVWQIALLTLMGLAPPLLFRLVLQGSSMSTLHAHPQGLLYLGHRIALASPFLVISQVGTLGLLAPLLLVPALSATAREKRGLLALFVALPWACVWTPLFTILHAKGGYLVPRFLELVPAAAVVALAGHAATRGWRLPLQPRALLRLPLLLVVLGFAGQAAFRLPGEIAQARMDANGPETPVRFRDALQALSLHVVRPDRRPPVILADPFTSYAVSGVTGAHVVATLNQHAPPTDARWRKRLEDQKEMLLACAGREQADSLLQFYEVDAVFVNGGLPLPQMEFGSVLNDRVNARILRRFSDDPERFPILYQGPDGIVFGVRRTKTSSSEAMVWNPDTSRSASVRGTASRPEGSFARDSVGEAPRHPRALNAPAAAPRDSTLLFPGPFRYGAVVASDVRLPAYPLHPGEIIRIPVTWKRIGPIDTDLPLLTFLRIHTRLPERWFLRATWSKPGRRLAEYLDHRSYRAQRSAPLLPGDCSPSSLPLGMAVADTLIIRVPGNAALGRYEVTLIVLEEPFVRNLRWRDLLQDEEGREGTVIGSIRVTARPEPAGRDALPEHS